MNKLAAISRADLLAAQLSSGGLDDFTAQLLGFQRKSKAPPVQKSQIDPNAGEATKDTPDTPPSPAHLADEAAHGVSGERDESTAPEGMPEGG